MRPVFQNRGSKHRTPRSYTFDLHYADLGVISRWDRDRYYRLCSFLQLTPYELASMICWPHSQVDSAVANSKFPGPVALLLTLVEAQVMQNYTRDVILNPLPSNGPSRGPQKEELHTRTAS